MYLWARIWLLTAELGKSAIECQQLLVTSRHLQSRKCSLNGNEDNVKLLSNQWEEEQRCYLKKMEVLLQKLRQRGYTWEVASRAMLNEQGDWFNNRIKGSFQTPFRNKLEIKCGWDSRQSIIRVVPAQPAEDTRIWTVKSHV